MITLFNQIMKENRLFSIKGAMITGKLKGLIRIMKGGGNYTHDPEITEEIEVPISITIPISNIDMIANTRTKEFPMLVKIDFSKFDGQFEFLWETVKNEQKEKNE